MLCANTLATITIASIFIAGEICYGKSTRGCPSNCRFNAKSILAHDDAEISELAPKLQFRKNAEKARKHKKIEPLRVRRNH